MKNVRAKKHLGQHFLIDLNIAKLIAHSLQLPHERVLEIGPGMGVLTEYLLQRYAETWVAEIDRESVDYLQSNFPALDGRILEGDFLKMNMEKHLQAPFALIGNFPYNISSQILFKVLDLRNDIPEVVGMFQKEVAERIAAGPGSKTYGILSVLLQAYYNIEYLFTVDEDVFDPPPKVKSGVVRLARNKVCELDCNEKLFVRVVKASFGQRRKTLRNALKNANFNTENVPADTLEKRAEQLSGSDFVTLANLLKNVI